MSSPAPSLAASRRADERLAVLFEELAELTGQRNAIDGRIVEIVAEVDRDRLWAAAGARSVASLVAWKAGVTPARAETIATLAHRLEGFPVCHQGLREGRLSLDQVGTIAERAADGSDEHYAELAASATVTQLRFALKLAPKPKPEPRPEPEVEPEPDHTPEPAPVPEPSISKSTDGQSTTWRITLPALEAAKFEAALASHQDALITDWKRDHDTEAHDTEAADGPGQPGSGQRPPMPTTGDAFLALVEASWDAEASRRPHGQHTTVVAHLDLDKPVAALHLGPLLSDADRRYLTCDATCEVWFERHGRPIGAGRTTRTVNRRLRRALEHRDRCCAVPGCGATHGLHAHHIRHWEDGGPTDLNNLVLVCPYHHRAHHRGLITITGPADQLVVTDGAGRALSSASLARTPTTPPPAAAPYKGPTGERADWWWYEPFQPQPPPSAN
ncbi:HNH endonuclease signature motif containing protein [Mycolicibacterium chubuense]|uniref:HNH endonuclease signature motif containing protein n=1 Tax=Mycolicibacterium chubuense TaxID=1800 RepID=UPI0002D56766|nr:HNH endonuclease signature motif containing protein [Mycolicibacterium chubuense]